MNRQIELMGRLILITLSLMCLSASVWAKDGFTTTFNLADVKDSTLFEIRIHDGERGYTDWRFDTIQIVNGKGVLTDISHQNYPVKAFAFTPYGVIDFYVGNNEHEIISGSVKDIENVSLNFKGASWSEDLMMYNKEVNSPIQRLSNKVRRMSKLSKEESDSINSGFRNLDKKKKNMYCQYPNSWITLIELISQLQAISREDVRNIYKQLTSDRQESKYGKILKSYLSLTPIEEGASLSVYDIEGVDQKGNPFKLSDMKEPYIVVDFSQCYCGPCIMAAKEIAQLKEKFAGVVGFVNYSCDDKEEDWRKSVERDNITWPSVFDGTGPQGEVCLKYDVGGYPTFFIYGPDRTLVKKWEGYGPGLIETELKEFINL